MPFKISIVTQDNFAVLGINGVESFFKAFQSNELDSVQLADEQFIEKIKLMETYEYGFTQDFKEKFIKVVEAQKGNKVLIADAWLVSYESEEAQKYMAFVKKLNEDVSFEDAKKMIFSL